MSSVHNNTIRTVAIYIFLNEKDFRTGPFNTQKYSLYQLSLAVTNILIAPQLSYMWHLQRNTAAATTFNSSLKFATSLWFVAIGHQQFEFSLDSKSLNFCRTKLIEVPLESWL